MHDNDRQGRDPWIERTHSKPLAVHEQQATFEPDTGLPKRASYGRSLPSRGDAVLIHHAVGVVDRLTDLITEAVQASDDARASALDRILQKAEAVFELAQADSRAVPTSPNL